VLEAGPGTGKTQTLAARVRFLLDRPEAPVDPRNILVLTFSNKAAGELADRIAVKSPDAAVAAWIGTFHGFGYDLLKTHHARLGFEREPSLMDRTKAVELLEAEVSRLGLDHYRDLWDPTENLREILSAISRAQDEVRTPHDYEQYAKSMLTTDPEGAAKALEVAAVYRRYQDIKFERGAVDFGDLATMPVFLLRDHPEVRAELQDRFRHILVDEQPSSVSLRRSGRRIWLGRA
jgi:superfamily I DNA/RNA helicase